MSKIKVAVYDTDQGYRERFADYLMSYKAAEIELAVFSSQEFFFNALNEETFQLLVLGKGYEAVIALVKTQQVPVLILTQAPHSYVQEEIALNEQQIFYMGKYQSMDRITKKMWMMAELKGVQENVSVRDDKVDLIGVISPIRHELQMFFSLLYAKNMARKRSVLYVNLLEFSGFAEIIGETEYDLGDAILSLREKTVQKERFLECIYEGNGFSYISPLLNPENIREVTADDLSTLVRFVCEYTDFEVIILDISTSVNCLAKVLAACSKLYCIEKKGFLSEVRGRQFWDYLSKVAENSFLERAHRITLPCQTRIVCGGNNLLEQLDWNELGDFVREQL